MEAIQAPPPGNPDKRSAPDATLLDSQSAQATQNLTQPDLTGRFGEDARRSFATATFRYDSVSEQPDVALGLRLHKTGVSRTRVVVRSGGNDIMAGWIAIRGARP